MTQIELKKSRLDMGTQYFNRKCICAEISDLGNKT
jgi:hypothetical protein